MSPHELGERFFAEPADFAPAMIPRRGTHALCDAFDKPQQRAPGLPGLYSCGYAAASVEQVASE